MELIDRFVFYPLCVVGSLLLYGLSIQRTSAGVCFTVIFPFSGMALNDALRLHCSLFQNKYRVVLPFFFIMFQYLKGFNSWSVSPTLVLFPCHSYSLPDSFAICTFLVVAFKIQVHSGC